MILPFSMMNYAEAEGQTNDKITKLVQCKKELQSELRESLDKSEKIEI